MNKISSGAVHLYLSKEMRSFMKRICFAVVNIDSSDISIYFDQRCVLGKYRAYRPSLHGARHAPEADAYSVYAKSLSIVPRHSSVSN